MAKHSESPSFFSRVRMGFACIFDSSLARKIAPIYAARAGAVTQKTEAVPPERVHASGLALMSLLQREGRLIDFLQEDVTAFPDADVGAAARVVHAGCRKVLEKSFDLTPVLNEGEGARIEVPEGFDAQRIRLAGNITGQPPFRGVLKHHGWVTGAVRLPTLSEAIDPRVIAPAEVEI